ncbi:hypothetical protein V2E24_02160 [Mycoplasmopsis ciconiae]|uniref:CvpA family protein n=1 Tax=Mycoplasmopsis ciconiae TaxID=561067 RepID=A0ABU7MLL9_9BACT|nr:hypothetical protein [Mycoplasmopsis ciconiae]
MTSQISTNFSEDLQNSAQSPMKDLLEILNRMDNSWVSKNFVLFMLIIWAVTLIIFFGIGFVRRYRGLVFMGTALLMSVIFSVILSFVLSSSTSFISSKMDSYLIQTLKDSNIPQEYIDKSQSSIQDLSNKFVSYTIALLYWFIFIFVFITEEVIYLIVFIISSFKKRSSRKRGFVTRIISGLGMAALAMPGIVLTTNAVSILSNRENVKTNNSQKLQTKIVTFGQGRSWAGLISELIPVLENINSLTDSEKFNLNTISKQFTSGEVDDETAKETANLINSILKNEILSETASELIGSIIADNIQLDSGKKPNSKIQEEKQEQNQQEINNQNKPTNTDTQNPENNSDNSQSTTSTESKVEYNTNSDEAYVVQNNDVNEAIKWIEQSTIENNQSDDKTKKNLEKVLPEVISKITGSQEVTQIPEEIQNIVTSTTKVISNLELDNPIVKEGVKTIFEKQINKFEEANYFDLSKVSKENKDKLLDALLSNIASFN